MFKSVGEELAFNKRMGFWNKGKKSAAYVVRRLMDWSGNAGYDKNDPKTYFSTMG